METDGQHASGLPYVPYDGYIAELHRGEAVINAGQLSRLQQSAEKEPARSSDRPINVTLSIDKTVLARVLVDPMKTASFLDGGSMVSMGGALV